MQKDHSQYFKELQTRQPKAPHTFTKAHKPTTRLQTFVKECSCLQTLHKTPHTQLKQRRTEPGEHTTLGLAITQPG